MNPPSSPHRPFWITAVILAILTTLILIRGDQTHPKIVDTNLKNEAIPLSTRQITLTFNRNMNEDSVEEHFSLSPALPGKFSWIGRRMAYSFSEPLKAGQTFTITLQKAQDTLGNVMRESYKRTYTVSNQRLYFIGAASQKGRLVSHDFASGEQKTLSPEGLTVTDFWVNPSEQHLLMLAHGEDPEKSSLFQLDSEGEWGILVDGEEELIFSVALSPNGQLAAIYKGKRIKFGDYSTISPENVWIYHLETGEWEEFWSPQIYGNDFYFSPDSEYLVGRDIGGDLSIYPLKEGEVIFLGGYSGHHAISPRGDQFAFVEKGDLLMPNDLLIRKEDGTTHPALEQMGQIQFPAFSPDSQKVYFLMSQSKEGIQGWFSPYYLHEYDLATNAFKNLTNDPAYFEGFFSISADGSLVATERYPASEEGDFFETLLDENPPDAEIWLYNTKTGELKSSGLKGSHPYLN